MNPILRNDLARMAANPPPQPAGRVSVDPQVISDADFHVKHGMTREQYAEREQLWRRRDIEERATADLDKDLAALSATSDNARRKFQTFHLLMGRERGKLSALQSRREQFQEFVNAPTATRSKISDAVTATKRWLLGGSSEEPAVDRAALDAELAAQQHKAEAAAGAIAEIDKQIEVTGIRVAKLQEAEKGFLNDAVAEVTSDLVQALARKRGEVAALERMLDPLRRFGIALNGKPEPVEFKWRNTWVDVAAALRSDPGADVSKLLPRVPA